MTLDFIWIKEYGVIKNQGINLNPNVYYTYDEVTGLLSKKLLNDIPLNFFNIANDTITNISALVGANGTGKSTILQFISSFLTSSRPLGGFIINSNQIINKSDNLIEFSEEWDGERPLILNRLDLINNYRKINGLEYFDETEDTRNNRLGLRILDNLITDTRLIYFCGETNLEHTNRVYQSLLSLSDEYENSLYTDISDIALMANDQNRYRSDKAIYSGENPVLAYRAGESQRFINLMLSDHKNAIPFSLDSLNLVLKFNDIDKVFFDSYDEIAFSTIMSLLQSYIKLEGIKFSKKSSSLRQEIEEEGLGGYFNKKFYKSEQQTPKKNLKINLYHHLLLRHIREQIMETMGELTTKDKLNQFLALISDIENSFTSSKSYLSQIQDYFQNSRFANQFTGSLNLEAVEVVYKKLKELDLWEYETFRLTLSDLENIYQVFLVLQSFDSESGLKYNASTIFDFDIRGLSTGEKQFLKIFSRFIAYNLNNKSRNKTETQFLILLDEFDLGFHPLWQRRFLNTWINFLEKYINLEYKHKIRVQLILTSHSPFLVSDLPKQCINFLSRREDQKNSKVDNVDKHKATFGANIHELFSDSFFLSGALMGDFAKSKIDFIFSTLQSEESIANPDYLKNLINTIGDTIIKTKLTEMLANKLGENVELTRLKMHKEYINLRLKEIENNDSN